MSPYSVGLRSMASKVEPATVRCTARTQLIGDRMVLRLPGDASAALPSRGQIAATVTLNDHAQPMVVEPDGRRGHWLPIDEDLRATVGVGVGDIVAIRIEPTKAWPEPQVPDDFAAALADATDLHETWADITPMARWEWVRWIGATKNPDTRARRVEVGLSKMRSGKRRPCCFDLSSCTDPEVAKSGKLVDPD